MSEIEIVINNIEQSGEIQNIINKQYYHDEQVRINILDTIITAIEAKDINVLQAVVDYALGIGHLYDRLLSQKESDN